MDQAKSATSRLLNSSVVDPKDELDERLESCYSIVNGITAALSDREANDALTAHICKGPKQYEEVQLGCFFSIIVDTKSAPKSYRDLMLLNRDGLNFVLTKANQVIHEKWLKLRDAVRNQILWFTKELVRNQVTGTESVCNSLLRQIAGGDVSPKNIWLTETLLDILAENKTWLEKVPSLMSTAVYTFLRVIVDHVNPSLQNLRQKEVEFCVSLMREKWTDCAKIGRDLVRVLQYVARIPEIEKLWRDILHNPTGLHPQFTGLQQLLQTRTSRRFLISRLTPDMENKLVFLTSKVKFGQQKRYQDWFQRQYLSTPESQSLRCDLIRYICAVIHPSNEVLCSDIIPRWAVIGWLLTTCTSNVAASNAKLALFYDWLFFDPEKDNIMNIEPCILVMHHSMRPHPAITATLLDFMCRVMTNFYPPFTPQVKLGVKASLKTILEKRVLPSLSPLFDNAKLDRELRNMIRENFIEFCSQEAIKEEPQGPKEKEVISIENNNHVIENNTSISEIAEFSDEDDDNVPLDKLRSDVKFRPIKELVRAESIDITEYLDQLEGDLRTCVLDLQSESDSNEIQCEIMDRLVQTIIRDEFYQENAVPLATCICSILNHNFSLQLFPQELDEDSLEDSIGTALFVIFRNLCQTPEEDPSRQPILMLLEEMYSKQQKIGYNFLYFLKVGKVHDEKMSAYKDFCRSLEGKDISTCLMTDLKLCQEDDVRLFTFLVPDIYSQFPNIAIGNTDLLHLIVSSIDGTQLQDLICQILQGHLVMFRKDSFLSILNASLEWETIEQFFLWQLIAAHNIPVEHIMPVLPRLEFQANAEALTSILIQLKQESPSAELLKPILCRECRKRDLFVVSILKYWAQEYEDRLGDLLNTQLTKFSSTPNRKRKGQQTGVGGKTGKEKDGPTVEQILAHLDHMRQTCKNISFLTHESIQQALQQVQLSCSESLKARYSDLLALVEDVEDMKSTRSLRPVPSRRASQSINNLNKLSNKSRSKQLPTIHDGSESETESSSEEEIIKPKAKKRRKTAVAEDDSD